MTRHRNRHCSIVVASTMLIATGMLSGCVPTPEPTPTPTAAFASEEEAFAAAESTYRAYIDASNAVTYDDPSSFEGVFSYTAGEYEESERKDFSEMHASRYVRGGSIEVLSFIPEQYENESIRATACNDVSQTTLTDEDGNSLVSPDRPNRVAVRLTMTAADGALYITAAEAIDSASCAS